MAAVACCDGISTTRSLMGSWSSKRRLPMHVQRHHPQPVLFLVGTA